jgi:density-regulated protein DRP1
MAGKVVSYCARCTLPFEYCMYGPSPADCAAALLASNPQLHALLYPPVDAAATAATTTTTVDSSSSSSTADAPAVGDAEPGATVVDDAATAVSDADGTTTTTKDKDDDNGEGDGDDDGASAASAPAVKKPKKKLVSIVTSQRQKKKHITAVTGLEAYNGTKLPPVAKAFSKKFACQSSATKDADELLVQGDFAIEVAETLVAEYGVKKSDIKIVQQKRG